jgi:hypothetical protein
MSKSKKGSSSQVLSESRIIDPCNKNFKVLNFAYESATNVVSFKESAYNYAIKEYGQASLVIIQERLYTVPPPVRPPNVGGESPFSQTNDPDGIKKEFFFRQLAETARLQFDINRQSSRIYGLLWSNCSRQSQE